jgi:DNA-binding MarR family transcriptional regulator
MVNKARTPSADTSPDAVMERRLGYQLRRASAAMMADLGASLAPLVLRPVEATMLIIVGENPGITQSAIGRALGIQRANMAPLMMVLVARGLIDKSPADGRSHALELTDAGAALREQAEEVMDAHEARFSALLDEVDCNTLAATLGKIAHRG